MCLCASCIAVFIAVYLCVYSRLCLNVQFVSILSSFLFFCFCKTMHTVLFCCSTNIFEYMCRFAFSLFLILPFSVYHPISYVFIPFCLLLLRARTQLFFHYLLTLQTNENATAPTYQPYSPVRPPSQHAHNKHIQCIVYLFILKRLRGVSLFYLLYLFFAFHFGFLVVISFK